MNLPSETKPVLWGATGGAIAVIAIGFMWGGWMTGGAANQMARNQASDAVAVALAPICVDKFKSQPEASVNLAELKKMSAYARPSYVEKGGWATMAGSEAPSSATAKACAKLLSELTL